MVTITVYGRLAGKGSRTIGKAKNGRSYTRPASKYEKPWVTTVADQALWRTMQPGDFPTAPYRVELTFYFAPPKKSAHKWPSKIDLDKLCRATIDGLVAGKLLTDDRHVVALSAEKRYAQTAGGECCQITVTPA